MSANIVTADKVSITQLSAIAADMGLVTAGTFKTSSGTGWRVELSSSGSYPIWVGSGATIDLPNSVLALDGSGVLHIRGMKIYDDSDNVIMASGSGLDWANANAPDFDDIGGATKPQDNATSTGIGSNLIRDPNFELAKAGAASDYWTLVSTATIEDTAGEAGGAALKLAANGATSVHAKPKAGDGNLYIPAKAGMRLYCRARVFASSDFNGTGTDFRIEAQELNVSKSGLTFPDFVTSTSLVLNSWVTVTGELTLTNSATEFMTFGAYVHNAETGYVIVDSWEVSTSPFTYAGDLAANVTAPNAGLKLNYASFTAANNGEAFIHGFDDSGAPANVAGWTSYDGAKLALPLTEVPTGSANSRGFILFETALTAPFTMNATSNRDIVLAWRVGSTWYYDDNSTTPKTFTKTDSMIAIGDLVTDTSDLILTGQIWASAQSLDVLPEPSATVGADSTNLKVGPGANMLKNSQFFHNETPWIITWENTSNTVSVGHRETGDDWALENEGTIQLYDAGAPDSGAVADLGYPELIPVLTGVPYEVSGYVGEHRCHSGTKAYIGWYDSAKAFISENIVDTSSNTKSGGKNLLGYERIGGIATAPANATFAKPWFRKQTTAAGESTSYLFMTHPYFGEAYPGQTELSRWVPGREASDTADGSDKVVGAHNKITSGNISTYMNAVAIGTAQIGNAAVDTLQIAGQAVTIPSGAYTSGQISVGDSWVAIQSVTFTSTGAPVHIAASFAREYSGSGTALLFRIKRGSTVIWGDVSTGLAEFGAANVKDDPGSGSVTYTIEAKRGIAAGTNYAADRSLMALELKDNG